MADLPRYQDIGVRSAPWQPQNTVGFQAAAQGSKELADNLTRLSTFAFGEAAKAAEVEGLEYGAANAPTVDQLKRAHETGENVIPGGTSSVFGRAAREGALKTVTRDIEIDARNKMAELYVTAKSQNMPALEFQKGLQNIIDGYGSSVSHVSPYTAGSVRASLSSVASQQYITYANWALEKETARQKIAVEGGIDTVIKNVANIVAAGDDVTGDTAMTKGGVTVDQKLASERTKILQWSLSINDAGLANSKLKEFNDAVGHAKTATIATWTQSTESGVPTLAKYNQVMTGRITDPTIANMWAGMSNEQRTKAQEEVRKQMTATLSLNKALDDEVERQRKEAQAKNRIEFQKAYGASDAAGMQRALSAMDQLHDAEGFEKYREVAMTKQAHTEPGLMLNLEDQLTRGMLNNEKILDLVRQKRLSDVDARAMIAKVETVSNKDVTESMEFVKREMGYPDRSMINPSAIDRRAIQQVNRINNAMIIAKRQAETEGKPFDAFSFAQKQIEVEKKNAAPVMDIAKAEARVKALGSLFGLPPDAPVSAIKQEQERRKILPENDKNYRNPRTQADFDNALDILLKNGSN